MQSEILPMSLQFPAMTMAGVDIELDDITKDIIDETRFWVEASTDEVHELWGRIAKDADKNGNTSGTRYNWKDFSNTQLRIGEWGPHPLTICIRWITINDMLIGFYGSEALVVHYEMIEHFLMLVSLSYRCGLHCYSSSFVSRINGLQTEIQRFNFSKTLVTLTKRKQTEEAPSALKESKTE